MMRKHTPVPSAHPYRKPAWPQPRDEAQYLAIDLRRAAQRADHRHIVVRFGRSEVDRPRHRSLVVRSLAAVFMSLTIVGERRDAALPVLDRLK